MPFTSSLQLNLPNTPDTIDPDLFEELKIIYDAIKNFSLGFDIHVGSLPVLFSEAVALGQGVNLYNNAGTLNARKSDATSSAKLLHGYAPKAVVVNTGGLVILSGIIETLTGLTPGATYYTSNTPGAFSVTAGTNSQKVGFALSPTTLYLQPALI